MAKACIVTEKGTRREETLNKGYHIKTREYEKIVSSKESDCWEKNKESLHFWTRSKQTLNIVAKDLSFDKCIITCEGQSLKNQ